MVFHKIKSWQLNVGFQVFAGGEFKGQKKSISLIAVPLYHSFELYQMRFYVRFINLTIEMGAITNHTIC